MDKLMDPPMATLLVKGIEGKHWKDGGDVTLPLDRDADVKEVKPYGTLCHSGMRTTTLPSR